MAQRVLFVAPTYQQLYKDLLDELMRQGYDVVYKEDGYYRNVFYALPNEFFNYRFNDFYLRQANKHFTKYWKEFFASRGEDNRFDILFVVDGISMCNVMFETLERYNPNIRKILYLYDALSNRYRFDRFFSHFHKIYTFDLDDAAKFGLGMLPMWWKPTTETAEHYDIFGFASFGVGRSRYEVFHNVKEVSDKFGLNSYIKLYRKRENAFYRFVKKLFRLDISLLVEPEMVTHTPIPAEKFRALNNSASIILDALGQPQSGLSPRFCWAIGAGKKIITDNVAVKRYSFYDPRQVLIIDRDCKISPEFFEDDFVELIEVRKAVDKFRLDNFVKTLMEE